MIQRSKAYIVCLPNATLLSQVLEYCGVPVQIGIGQRSHDKGAKSSLAVRN